jgi:hypothetical protein
MSMLLLGNTVLLVSMGTGNLVSNVKLMKVGVEMLIFPTPIKLYGDNLLIKPSFNKRLNFQEKFEDIRFMTQQIEPCEFTIIINERHILFLTTKRVNRRVPDIQKKASRCGRTTR